MSIQDNIHAILEKVAAAAKDAGRDPESIKLVAVTKTVDAQTAKEVMDAGCTTLGENRVQSFLEKYEVLGDAPDWHIIGHLQTNKVKYIVGKVSLIHSVDSLHLAEEISKKATALGITQDILLQFNISGEESKSGASEDEAESLLAAVSALSGIRVCGLMTMAPLDADEEETRAVFKGLRSLFEKLKEKNYPGVALTELSMGMSNDFELAVKEGATLIRIGRSLFR